MRVEHNNNSPSYKAMWWANHTFSQTQKNVIKDITKKLNTTKKGYFSDKSPMKWLEGKGYDVFVSSGDHRNSVKMQLVDRVKHPKKENNKVSVEAYVGEYSKGKPFNTNDVKEARKRVVESVAAISSMAVLMLGTIFGFHSFAISSKQADKIPQKVEQVSKAVSDTVKNLSKDTIAPWKLKK